MIGKTIKTNKMKTIEQWLKTLPKELRESALKQAIKQNKKLKRPSLSSALWGFALWIRTKEGFDFWEFFTQALEWAESND